MEEKKNKDLAKKLKVAALTGATVCVIATSLMGCGSIKNNRDSYEKPNISSESVVKDYDRDQNDRYDQNPSQTAPQTQIEMSYNAFLYSGNNNSLSSSISADAFGFQMSAKNDNADRRLEVGEYNPIAISIDENSYNEYVKWVDSENVVYVYSDLYNIDYSLAEAEKYEQATSRQATQHKDLITDINTIPSVEMIQRQILENTSNFLKEHPEYQSLDSSYIRMISEIMADTIERYHDSLSTEDLNKIYCMLTDIKAVGIDSTDFTVNELRTVYNARVTEDGLVILDTNQISKMGDEQSAERTVSHEIIHLFQRMCPDHQITGYTQIGNSQYFESFENTTYTNSLHFQWLYEAAAEKMSMANSNAKTPLVYKNMVGYLNTLDLITLIRPGYEENSIELSQLSNDPEKIYEVFGAETPEEKKEIIEMLYSICYVQNEREDFTAAYEDTYGSIDGKETTIKKEMKPSIIKTMTKYFYRNLAERMAHSDVTMQDAFYLMNVFESAVNLHMVYDDESRYDLNKDAIEYYIEAQDKLFEMIALNSEYSFEEIVEMYSNYALVIKNGNEYQRNNSFTWLTDSEKEYIGDVLTTNIQNLTINIRDLEFATKSNSR